VSLFRMSVMRIKYNRILVTCNLALNIQQSRALTPNERRIIVDDIAIIVPFPRLGYLLRCVLQIQQRLGAAFEEKPDLVLSRRRVLLALRARSLVQHLVKDSANERTETMLLLQANRINHQPARTCSWPRARLSRRRRVPGCRRPGRSRRKVPACSPRTSCPRPGRSCSRRSSNPTRRPPLILKPPASGPCLPVFRIA